MVDLRGLEPLTFCMPCRRAPSCATGPRARVCPASLRMIPRDSLICKRRTPDRRYPPLLGVAIGMRLAPGPRGGQQCTQIAILRTPAQLAHDALGGGDGGVLVACAARSLDGWQRTPRDLTRHLDHL